MCLQSYNPNFIVVNIFDITDAGINIFLLTDSETMPGHQPS